MLKPVNGNILIEVEKPEKTTDSGIVIPDEVLKKVAFEKARIIDLAPEVTDLKKGQTIYFKLYNMDTIEIEKKEYTFIKQEDVLAVE